MVVTGEGSSFCAGADFGEVYGDGFRKALYEMLRRFTASPVPIIAAVNGPAIGAGTQLALAADLRMVSPGATFAVPTATLGLAVDPWTIRRLALLAGGGNARRILLACEPLSAEDALQCGLADAAGDLDAALERAARIAALAPLTLAYSKQVLNRLQEPEIDDRGSTHCSRRSGAAPTSPKASPPAGNGARPVSKAGSPFRGPLTARYPRWGHEPRPDLAAVAPRRRSRADDRRDVRGGGADQS